MDSLTASQGGRKVVRVLIVDDHRVVADGLRLVLDEHPDLEVIATAGDGAAALRLASTTPPDLVLVDYRLPDMTGAELAAQLRDRQPGIRVLFLSMVISAPLIREAVKAGARGYLVKTQPAEELVDAVRRAARGEMLVPAATLAGLVVGDDEGAQLLDRLTPRETDVLRLMAEGLDNRAIAARLGIGYVTARSHLRNLSSKLGAHSKLEILARAVELGLVDR
jgi:DNA-binding NarL/FixJ family response regulator